MQPTIAHIESLDPKDESVARMLGGMSELLNGVQEQYVRCADEKNQYRMQLASVKQAEPTNVVADGMQNELIAVFNAMHERGMVTCTKKEFIERMASALGCPQLATNYNGQLYKIKQAYKYGSIFDDLKNSALQNRDKND